MRGSRLEFYADNQDLSNLLGDFDGLGDYIFVEDYSELNMPLRQYQKASDLEFFVRSSFPESGIKPRIYVLPINEKINQRTVVLSNGSGIRYIINQNYNPDSIILSIGGQLHEGMVLMSEIGTLGLTETAQKMLKVFKRAVQKHATRLGPKGTPYLVMPGALARWQAGARLARAKDSPPMMDPKISP